MINCFYVDGRYTHPNLDGYFIVVKSCEVVHHLDAVEIVYEVRKIADEKLILERNKMFVNVDDFFDWSQLGLC